MNWDLCRQTGTIEDELGSVSHYLQDFTCNDAGDLQGKLVVFGRELPGIFKKTEGRNSVRAGVGPSGCPMPTR